MDGGQILIFFPFYHHGTQLIAKSFIYYNRIIIIRGEKLSYEHFEEVETSSGVIGDKEYMLSFEIGTYGCGEPCNPMEDWEHMYLKLLERLDKYAYKAVRTEHIMSLEDGKKRFHECKKELDAGKFPTMNIMSRY